MFRDSIEAFLYVVMGDNRVKDVNARTGYLRNGVKHCRIQIECRGCAEYGIDAYGEVADRLFAEAKRYLQKVELVATA